jgi:excisionase family DNA binding protein
MSTSPGKRLSLFQRLFPRGPIVWHTFKLDLRDLSEQEDKRVEPALLADRIEKVGHALTARDLAELLNVSRITIFKRALSGNSPSFRIGTSVRFDPRAIATWLRNQ